MHPMRARATETDLPLRALHLLWLVAKLPLKIGEFDYRVEAMGLGAAAGGKGRNETLNRFRVGFELLLQAKDFRLNDGDE